MMPLPRSCVDPVNPAICALLAVSMAPDTTIRARMASRSCYTARETISTRSSSPILGSDSVASFSSGA
jgi:hypothetical protein